MALYFGLAVQAMDQTLIWCHMVSGHTDPHRRVS